MDRVVIKDLRLECRVGVAEEERKRGQQLLVDVEIFRGLREAGREDNIGKTADYYNVSLLIEKALNGREFRLIEAVAETIAESVLQQFNAERVNVRVKKPAALKNAGYAAVEITRGRR